MRVISSISVDSTQRSNAIFGFPSAPKERRRRHWIKPFISCICSHVLARQDVMWLYSFFLKKHAACNSCLVVGEVLTQTDSTDAHWEQF